MEFSFNNETNNTLEEYSELYEKLFLKTLKTLNLSSKYIVSVTIVSKEEIHRINREYRHIDRPTDVISFAFLDDKKEIVKGGDIPIDLGEIYICYDVAEENAKKYGNTLKRELCFLSVHGYLHLLGYDHITKEDETIMFGLQDVILPPNKEIIL